MHSAFSNQSWTFGDYHREVAHTFCGLLIKNTLTLRQTSSISYAPAASAPEILLRRPIRSPQHWNIIPAAKSWLARKAGKPTKTHVDAEMQFEEPDSPRVMMVSGFGTVSKPMLFEMRDLAPDCHYGTSWPSRTLLGSIVKVIACFFATILPA